MSLNLSQLIRTRSWQKSCRITTMRLKNVGQNCSKYENSYSVVVAVEAIFDRQPNCHPDHSIILVPGSLPGANCGERGKTFGGIRCLTRGLGCPSFLLNIGTLDPSSHIFFSPSAPPFVYLHLVPIQLRNFFSLDNFSSVFLPLPHVSCSSHGSRYLTEWATLSLSAKWCQQYLAREMAGTKVWRNQCGQIPFEYCGQRGKASIFISSVLSKVWRLTVFYRPSLSHCRVAVVCSARSSSSKADGTTNR
jgi:hypothetical protein